MRPTRVLLIRIFSKITLAFFSVVMVSCSGPIIECGCKSPKYVNLDNEPGIVVNTMDGYLVLSPNFGYMALCDQADPAIWVDGLHVKISGQLTKMCGTTGPEQWYIINHLASSTLVSSVDSLFVAPPIEIDIIKSEDYGYPAGYGYRMTKTSADGAFKVFQPIIPAVDGNQTFDTSLDAFKVAVFVAYRTTQSDLPSLKVDDMQYLLAYP